MVRKYASRRGLRGAGGLPVLLLLLFAALAAWFWLSYVPRKRAEAVDALCRDLGLRADLYKEALGRLLAGKLADAVTVASYPTVLLTVTEKAAVPLGGLAPSQGGHAHLQELLDGFAQIQKVLGVALWDGEARLLAKSRDLVLEESCAGPAREVLSTGRPVAGFHLHVGSGAVLGIGAPVQSTGGVTHGAVVLEIDPWQWVYPFLSKPIAGTAGEAFLVARDGDDIVHLSPLRHRPDAPLTFRRPLKGAGYAARTVLEGSEFAGSYVDYRGDRVVGAGRLLPPTPWALVVSLDEKEALAGFRERVRRTAFEMAASVVALLGVVWGFWLRRERLQRAALSRSEARTRQVNRLLRTIGEINEVMVRSDDGKTLLSESCRVLVERGGFRMAWVGLVDGQKGLVVPAGRAGEASAYLDGITVRFDETPDGQGPAGTAIRTGRHVVIPDLVSDPSVAMWRERMLRHGFRTTGAFPFRVRGRAGGVLMVYLAEPGTIGEEETNLLDKLADDLGYSLEVIEVRVERKRAEEALRESEARLRSLLEGIGLIAVILDGDGRIVLANDALLRLVGRTRTEIIGADWFETFLPPDVRSVVRGVFRDSLGSGFMIPEYENEVLVGGGERRLVRWSNTVLRDKAGAVAGTASVGEDVTERRKFEAALREAEEKYRSIFEHAVEGIFQTTPDGRLVAANPSFARMLGYESPEEIFSAIQDVGRELWVHPERREEYRRVLQGEGVVRGFEIELRRKDGSSLWVCENARAVCGPTGAVQFFEGTVEDITGRKQAEDARRESEERYRLLVEDSPDAIMLHRDGRLLFVNRAAVRLFGAAEPADLIGRPVLERVHPEFRAIVRERIATLRGGGSIPRLEEKLLKLDGSEIGVEVAASRVSLEGEEAVQIVARDVTARKKGEEAVRRSRKTMVELLDASPDSTLLLDRDYVVLACNRAMALRLGLSFTDVIGRSVFEFLPAEVAETRRAKLDEVVRTGRTVRFRDEQAGFILDNTIVPVADLSGEVRQLAVFGRDVTTVVRAEVELARAQQQFLQAQKMEAVGRLAGGVAHDFNNILTVIQGYGEVLSASLRDDELRREQVAEIVSAAGRAAALTRQLLAFSRRQVFELRLLDLGEVVSEMQKMLRRLIGEDVTLVVEAPRAIGRVKADPGQIEQVLMNLVVNSRDAMPKGGRLALRLETLDLDLPLLSQPETVPPGRYVVLRVNDTGCGMDAETLGHAFEPFFTTKERGKGTGLGLSTVFGIVKQSGGFLGMESEPGQGTAVSVYLPRAEDEAAARPEAVRPGAGGTETILLVEDETAVRELARRLLEGRGYRVLVADGAAEALELADRHEGAIGLLLTDVVMPGMNGRELATEIVRRRPGTRVLFMSGYSSDILTMHRIEGGAAHLLYKPFTEAALASHVRQILDAPGPGA